MLLLLIINVLFFKPPTEKINIKRLLILKNIIIKSCPIVFVQSTKWIHIFQQYSLAQTCIYIK